MFEIGIVDKSNVSHSTRWGELHAVVYKESPIEARKLTVDNQNQIAFVLLND